MPLLTRVFIRLALFNLFIGFALWIAYQANQANLLNGTWYALRPIAIHYLTVGWLTQLIFAVIYWMFPIVNRETPYGVVWVSGLGFISLNLGLYVRAVFEIGLSQGWPLEAGYGLVGAAVLQWTGITALVLTSWNRVRPRGGVS